MMMRVVELCVFVESLCDCWRAGEVVDHVVALVLVLVLVLVSLMTLHLHLHLHHHLLHLHY